MSLNEYSVEDLALKELGIRKSLKKALISPIEMLITYLPGPAGYLLRRAYYSKRLKYLGKGVLIDIGVIIRDPGSVAVHDYTWIDRYVSIEGLRGVTIGRRVHIAPYSLIQGGGKVYIGDYVGISSFCRIYSSTEHYEGGKRMSGPMVPPEHRAVKRAPVIIERDAFLGVGVTVLPGVRIGEGAVIGAHALVIRDIPPWTIAVGIPARPIKKRPRVKVPEE